MDSVKGNIKAKSAKETFRLMLKRVKAKQYVSWVTNAICGGVIPVLSVFILRIITQAITDENASVKRVLTLIVVYALGAMLLQIIDTQTEKRTYCSFNIIRMDSMKEAVTKFMTMDYGYYENPGFQNEAQAGFVACETNDSGLEGIYHRVYDMGKKVISALLLAVLLVFANPLIVITILVSITASVIISKKVTDYKHGKRVLLEETRRKVQTYQQETSDFDYGKDTRLFKISGKIFKAYSSELDRLKKQLEDYMSKEFRLSFIDTVFIVLCDLVAYIILITLYFGGMSIADFIMYLTAVTLFTATMYGISADIGFIREQFQYVKDLFGVLEADLITEGSDASFKPDRLVEIEFENVSFKYPASDRFVFENFNLVIRPGEKLALVGVNGAGKTTIVKLLTGLYRPDSGRILIDGTDYMTFSADDLHSLFGVVFQDIEPIAVTVKENVAASSDADGEKVIECLKTVGLWDKITGLPQGIDTTLFKVIDDDGVVLSGGENQKLMIARALYRDRAKIMIIDEPTASLDALAEEKIYQEFNSLMQGKTSLFISHRLASTRFCDRIVLLNGGRIEEEGTHDELMANNGLYAKMFETQGKYYQDAADNREADL